MTNPDSILKSRNITLPTKVRLVKAMVFPVVKVWIWESHYFFKCKFIYFNWRLITLQYCERWTIKKAERWRIDAFELRCLRRFLRVHWITRRSNQSILREISPGYFLEGLKLPSFIHWCWSWNSNTLATWCEELTHLKRPWCWERLKAGGEGDNRGWDGWRVSPTRWTWASVDSGSWWWTGRPGVLQSMGSQRVGHDWVTELNWNWR